MEVDGDVDAELMQQFSSMGTTDKEELIIQFQKLSGNQLNPEGCAFFLDMSNWNLQAAICAYYDFEAPREKIPCMTFVQDVTIGEGESIPPNNEFIKTWRIKNSGEESWPPGVCLHFLNGSQLEGPQMVLVGSLGTQQMKDVSVKMRSPATEGLYQSQWRLATATGLFFGEIIWVIIEVREGGMLSLTQQLSSLGQGQGGLVETSPYSHQFSAGGSATPILPGHNPFRPSPPVPINNNLLPQATEASQVDTTGIGAGGWMPLGVASGGVSHGGSHSWPNSPAKPQLDFENISPTQLDLPPPAVSRTPLFQLSNLSPSTLLQQQQQSEQHQHLQQHQQQGVVTASSPACFSSTSSPTMQVPLNGETGEEVSRVNAGQQETSPSMFFQNGTSWKRGL